MYSIISSANSESFTSFPIWVAFVYFPCLIAMTSTSRTMLNNSGESGNPCLVTDLSGNAYNFFIIENNVCCGFVTYCLYYVECTNILGSYSNRFQHWLF